MQLCHPPTAAAGTPSEQRVRDYFRPPPAGKKRSREKAFDEEEDAAAVDSPDDEMVVSEPYDITQPLPVLLDWTP